MKKIDLIRVQPYFGDKVAVPLLLQIANGHFKFYPIYLLLISMSGQTSNTPRRACSMRAEEAVSLPLLDTAVERSAYIPEDSIY